MGKEEKKPDYYHSPLPHCARPVVCSGCGEPIESVYDPDLRDRHDECGGYPTPDWADGMRELVEDRKRLRRRGV